MKHIIIADDAAVNRKLLILYLQHLPQLVIHEARNGSEVMRLLSKQEIHLVILDLIMPKLDGFDVLRLMQHSPEYRNIPVIVQSALSDQDYITKALELGAYDYFTKSSEMAVLAVNLPLKVKNALHSYGLYKAMENELVERQRAERALRSSEERYRMLIQQSKEGIILIDVPTQRIIEVNPYMVALSGYREEELRGMELHVLLDRKKYELEAFFRTVKESGVLPVGRRRYKKRDGTFWEGERSGSLIRYGDQELLLLFLRDVTAEVARQQQLEGHLRLAGTVQKGFLPPNMQQNRFMLRTIYQPWAMVSGDLYDYRWDEADEILEGYIMDVSGHGIATALVTSALKSLSAQAFEFNGPLKDKLDWLNQAVSVYCHDEFYAAMLWFRFDFKQRSLTYAAGGIHYIIYSNGEKSERWTIPGSPIGMVEEPEFTEVIKPLQEGDQFFFCTDGLSDLMRSRWQGCSGEFLDNMQSLRDLASGQDVKDDITVVGIAVYGI